MCSIHLCSALTKAIFLAVVTIQCEATTRPTLPNLEDHTTEQAVDTYTPSSVDNTDRTCDGSATIWGIYGQQHFYVQSRAACQDLCIASAECNFIQYQPSTSNLACHLYMDCATKRHCSGSCERTLEKASQACRDIVPKGQTVWHDSAGHQYTCAWYASKGKCSDLGDDYANFGYTANQACCSCGGGKASTPWPTFATATDLKADAWGVYFTAVYGDVPQTGYPFSVVDKVWMLYNVVLNNAKANAAQSVGRCPPSNAPKGCDTTWVITTKPQMCLGFGIHIHMTHLLRTHGGKLFMSRTPLATSTLVVGSCTLQEVECISTLEQHYHSKSMMTPIIILV
jgi:hypothetical protein